MTEIKVPLLPESVADATVLVWHKKAGDIVTRDEVLVDLETDKVVLEVPAPESGILTAITKEVGSKVLSGELLGQIEAAVAVSTPAAPEPVKAQVPPPLSSAAVPVTEASTSAQPALSPSVRRVVAENGVDSSKIVGTGKDGRITREDVINYLKEPQEKKEEKTVPVAAQPSQAPIIATAEENLGEGGRYEKRVPMSRLRSRIAERLLESQRTTAMLTTFNEVNLQAVMNLRKHYKDEFEKAHGVKLGFMSFFTKAVCEALKRFPMVNASIDGNDIIYHDYYDIGIAVSAPRGLVVPILRNADRLSLAQIEKSIAELALRARDGKLSLEDMTGGTFTISNGGTFGSLLSTPILNPPQSAILGMHKIEERPMAENGQVVIRPMMYVAMTYDHRIIDGRESVSFLVAVKNFLEDPSRLLLDI